MFNVFKMFDMFIIINNVYTINYSGVFNMIII